VDAQRHVLDARAADALEVERAGPAGAAARRLHRGAGVSGVAGGADDKAVEVAEAVVAGGGGGAVLAQLADGDGGVPRGVIVAGEGEARDARRAGGGGGGGAGGVEAGEGAGDALAEGPGDVRGRGQGRAGDEGRGGGERERFTLVGLRGGVVEAKLGEGFGEISLDPPALHECDVDVAMEDIGQHTGIISAVEHDLPSGWSVSWTMSRRRLAGIVTHLRSILVYVDPSSEQELHEYPSVRDESRQKLC
jgi:hypothetical protein